MLKSNCVNVNHIIMLIENLFIYDDTNSIYQFVTYNFFYGLSLFLDFPKVPLFISRLLGL